MRNLKYIFEIIKFLKIAQLKAAFSIFLNKHTFTKTYISPACYIVKIVLVSRIRTIAIMSKCQKISLPLILIVPSWSLAAVASDLPAVITGISKVVCCGSYTHLARLSVKAQCWMCRCVF